MSTNDDDYLSDKFLIDANASSLGPRMYSERRKETEKRSQLKNERNRTKSRRQLELESRESGLSRSLFERAKEEEASGIGSGNKALSIMMKMGFKPGQSLGRTGDEPDEESTDKVDTPHTTEPLPLQEWAGKKGIGLGKRPGSPSTSSEERLAKMAKMAEEVKHRDFRERARDEYNNRRAEGRLGPAQLTCRTLDERMGKSLNVLWLNPSNSNTFPPGLMEAVRMHNNGAMPLFEGETVESGMRKQMQADGLKGEEEGEERFVVDEFCPELLEEITQFLGLEAQDRLRLVLGYLRDKHRYCFWCGVEYGSVEDMERWCGGPEEEDHE